MRAKTYAHMFTCSQLRILDGTPAHTYAQAHTHTHTGPYAPSYSYTHRHTDLHIDILPPHFPHFHTYSSSKSTCSHRHQPWGSLPGVASSQASSCMSCATACDSRLKSPRYLSAFVGYQPRFHPASVHARDFLHPFRGEVWMCMKSHSFQ